jgi:hypothetical protein
MGRNWSVAFYNFDPVLPLTSLPSQILASSCRDMSRLLGVVGRRATRENTEFIKMCL